MLKREVVLSSLGITEEQAKEQNINVDVLIKMAQELGDSIAAKSNATIEDLNKKNEELSNSKTIEEPKTGDLKAEDMMSMVEKMLEERLGSVSRELEETKKTSIIKDFMKEAKVKGLAEEQIKYISENFNVDQLTNFNYDLFPKKVEEDTGQNKQDNKLSKTEEDLFNS